MSGKGENLACIYAKGGLLLTRLKVTTAEGSPSKV
ncbi:hypothetical protein J2S02_001502 [Metabacillus niabensis]|uniref:Uncharacterized protein n=1 Tax=Metabacillus niabensis TaxID=324854 RepID=A0ABT9YYW7_9BACI|nr:hypothetical protein [Metabacillus niabensis]